MELHTLKYQGRGVSTGLNTAESLNVSGESFNEILSRNDSIREIVSLDSEQNEDPTVIGTRAYLVVLGSFLGLVANFGVMNAVGVIQSYISQNQLKSLNESSISWIFSIYMYISFALGIFVGPLFVVQGSLFLLSLGTSLIFGGFFAVGSCEKVWQFILAFSSAGLGHGLSVTPLVSVINQHWPLTAAGKANGAASVGGSIGGVFFPLMLRSLFPKVGFTWSLRLLSFVCLFCMVPATFLAREKYCMQLNYHNEYDEGKHKMTTRKKVTLFFRNLLHFGALRNSSFVLLIFASLCGELVFILIITFLASYAISQGMSPSSSYILLTILNGSGILGRFIPGAMADIWGPLNIMTMMILGLDLSILIVWLPFGSHDALLYVFSVLAGLFSGSILSLLPVNLASINVYGYRKVKAADSTITTIKYPLEFGQKYGLTYVFVSSGNLFGVPLASAVIGNGDKDNYSHFVLLTGMIGLASALLWISSRIATVGLKFRIKI